MKPTPRPSHRNHIMGFVAIAALCVGLSTSTPAHANADVVAAINALKAQSAALDAQLKQILANAADGQANSNVKDEAEKTAREYEQKLQEKTLEIMLKNKQDIATCVALTAGIDESMLKNEQTKITREQKAKRKEDRDNLTSQSRNGPLPRFGELAKSFRKYTEQAAKETDVNKRRVTLALRGDDLSAGSIALLKDKQQVDEFMDNAYNIYNGKPMTPVPLVKESDMTPQLIADMNNSLQTKANRSLAEDAIANYLERLRPTLAIYSEAKRKADEVGGLKALDLYPNAATAGISQKDYDLVIMPEYRNRKLAIVTGAQPDKAFELQTMARNDENSTYLAYVEMEKSFKQAMETSKQDAGFSAGGIKISQ